MRTLAILNQKGGVGKTTTAVNFSAALARRGHRVCLVDLDPQAHASLHLAQKLTPSARPGCHMYHVFVEQVPLVEICQQAGEHLQVAPAHIDLAAVEVELAGTAGRELLLRRRLEEAGKRWDFVVMDCPPSLGILTLNALCAVEEVVLPLQPHFLALHGLSKLLETLEVVATRGNPRLRLSGVLLCMYESNTRLAQEVERDIDQFLQSWRGQNRPWSEARLFRTRIRRNVRLAEAPSFGTSIFDYAPKSPGAADYEALAQEFLESAPPLPPEITEEAFAQTMQQLSQPVQ